MRDAHQRESMTDDEMTAIVMPVKIFHNAKSFRAKTGDGDIRQFISALDT